MKINSICNEIVSDGSVPPYLYHYTTINTLGFILKNRTIRFNSLEGMDDTDEVKIWNKNFGKYCFVSCWTSQLEESIPMWKMYSNDLSGVRIKLPILPFKVYKKNNKEYIIDPEKLYTDNYFFSHAEKGTFLRKVNYASIEQVDNIKNGCIGKKAYEYLGYESLDLGYYKSSYWEFQEEWRYQIFAIPTKEKVTFEKEVIDKEYIDTVPDLPIKDVYLELDKEKFNQMEITMRPKTNEIDCLLVNMLVKEYNSGIKIFQSKLKNRI